MALSVTYTNFCGQIVQENRAGTQSYYVADTLGSTVTLVNSTGTVTDTWSYWPYGEIQSRTGTTPTPFTFGGVIGYFQDLLNDLTYVRNRVLRVTAARWQTVDLLWPLQAPYAFAAGSPVWQVDPSGLSPCQATGSPCNDPSKPPVHTLSLAACWALCGLEHFGPPCSGLIDGVNLSSLLQCLLDLSPIGVIWKGVKTLVSDAACVISCLSTQGPVPPARSWQFCSSRFPGTGTDGACGTCCDGDAAVGTIDWTNCMNCCDRNAGYPTD